MTNKAIYFKYSVLLIIVLAFFWLLSQIGCLNTGSKVKSNDTLSVVMDTVFIPSNDTIKVPYETLVPYKVVYRDQIVLHDTLESITTIIQKVDTARILNQYFAKRYYTKTSKVQYGTVTIKDTVTQNRITGRGIVLNQKIPVVKETVTLREPKRIVLYGGIFAIGNKDNLPYASGITLDLQLKNGAMVGVGAGLTQDKGMILASIKVPIRLRKR